jgi:hypothetical protein
MLGTPEAIRKIQELGALTCPAVPTLDAAPLRRQLAITLVRSANPSPDRRDCNRTLRQGGDDR